MLFYTVLVRLLGISSTCLHSFCLDNANVVVYGLEYLHNYRESLMPKARTQMTFHGKFDFDGKSYFAFQKYEYSLSEVRWEDHNIKEKIKIFKDIVLGLSELASKDIHRVELSPSRVVKNQDVWLLYGVTPITEALFNLGKIILADVTNGRLGFKGINNQHYLWMCNAFLNIDDRHWPDLRHLASWLFERRLDADEAMKHPAFLSEIEQLRFMSNLSDDLELYCRLRDDLEKLRGLVYATVNVGLVLHADFVRVMFEYVDYRTFGCNVVQGLIRMTRNTIHHLKKILEKKTNLKRLYKDTPKLYNYFCERYPLLFIEVFKVVYKFKGAAFTCGLHIIRRQILGGIKMVIFGRLYTEDLSHCLV